MKHRMGCVSCRNNKQITVENNTTISKMNSDEDYHPPKESLSVPRRSKRITRSETKSRKKNDEKPPRKSTTKTKTTPAKKQKTSPQSEQTSRTFSSSPLTRQELQQLYEKYTKDRHYFLIPRTSPAPLVVSRTTDGKVVTTKIECYKQKKYLMRELAATMTSPKTDNNEQALIDDGNDPSAVIFSTPLPDSCSKSSIVNVDSNSSCGPNLPVENTSARGKKTKKRSQTLHDSASRAQRTSDLGTGLPENPINFDAFAKPITANSLQNVPGIPSSSSAFSSVAPAQSKLRPTSSTWNSPEQANSCVKKQNCSSTSGFYVPISSTSQSGYNGSVANRFGCDSIDDPYGNRCNPSSLTMDDRFNSNGTTLNSRNSAFPLHDQRSAGNLSSNWNYGGQISSDTLAAYNSTTISSNSINGPSANSIDALQPSIIAYNSEVMSVNNRMCAIPANSCGLSGNTSEYRSSSFMSWNGVKVLPNSYSSLSDSSYGNAYGAQDSGGTYDSSGTAGVFDNSTDHVNSWSESQQSNRDCFLPNRDYFVPNKDCFLPNSNCLNDATNRTNYAAEQSIGHFPVITNLDDELALNVPPAKENFCNVQNSGCDPSAMSVCPYDDDITYKNCNENVDRNDENIVSSTQNGGFFSNLLMSVRNEVRPLFDDEYNYSQVNNDSSMDFAFYDFDNKREKIDESDCIAEMSRH